MRNKISIFDSLVKPIIDLEEAVCKMQTLVGREVGEHIIAIAKDACVFCVEDVCNAVSHAAMSGADFSEIANMDDIETVCKKEFMRKFIMQLS